VFERQAADFMPLYHALMAFSELSMSNKSGIANLDALQHYQLALPLLQANLRSEEDLISDGVFLTHFILLLYEIAAGEPRKLCFLFDSSFPFQPFMGPKTISGNILP